MSAVLLYQIPRNSLFWLLASMFAAIVPHAGRLPLWLLLVCLLCGCWRLMVYRGRWSLPGMLVRAVLVLSGFAAVYGHYGTLLGPEAGSALLVLGFCFKLMETHQPRDAFIVVVLGYFVVATSFFFDQYLVSAAYMGLVCIMITAALLGLNQSPLHTHPRRTLMISLRLLGQSVPLMVVLFVLVPRIGPVWSLDLGSGNARTGLSDRITPGDIANLSRSDARAFRVAFDPPATVPPPSQRYWRALVLSHYDGRTWSRGSVDMDAEPMVHWGSDRPPWLSSTANDNSGPNSYRYQVTMEPTDQRWLFAMEGSWSGDSGVGRSRDHRLLSRTEVRQTFSYRVESPTVVALDQHKLPGWLRRINLQLPSDGDPQSRQLAKRLWQQAESQVGAGAARITAVQGPSSEVDERYIAQVMALFAQQPFRYTLRLPRLSGDRIDQFLLQSRSGFCSHFAGAFVYLMRAAGLPARIVAGYQGGEINPLGGYLSVHQFDAHAWAEVWLEGRGWVRFDPTAQVAPERVEQGVEQALLEEGSFLDSSPLSPLRYRHLAWLTQLRLSWDYLNFSWHRWVLGYDAKAQQKLLLRWLGKVDFRQLGLLLFLTVGTLLAGLALWQLYWDRRLSHRDPVLRSYHRLCHKMSKRGVSVLEGESPSSYLARLQQRFPELTGSFKQLDSLLVALFYQPHTTNRAKQVKQLRQLVGRL
ncbi:MAG: DUF3488 and DUF4129 domain-containing transglutaminase family protein [Motiliproteus sp.]